MTGQSPQSLRDLSIALSESGDVERELGLLDNAASAFYESLEIRRRLAALTGNSPSSLRDLGVAFHKVSTIESKLNKPAEAERARSEYRAIQCQLQSAEH